MEKEKSTLKKTLGVVGNVLMWIFIVFVVVITVLAFAAQANPDGVPSIGGVCILTVQTPSMEPTFYAGDIIIGKKISPEEMQNLKVNDIITYKGDITGSGNRDELNTHRIIEVITDADGKITGYRTQGDHNTMADKNTVDWQFVICKYEGTRIAGLGKVLSFLQQPTGFLLVIVLPLVVFFLFELVIFIRKFVEVKNAGKKQITAEDEELIRQRAVEEYIRQQAEEEARKKAQQQADQAAEQPVEEAPEQTEEPAADESQGEETAGEGDSEA